MAFASPASQPHTSPSQSLGISRLSRKDTNTAVGLCIDPPNPVLVPLKPTRQPIISASEPDAGVSCEEVRVSEDEPEASGRRRKQTTCGAIGIEAADLTRLLEQFGTHDSNRDVAPASRSRCESFDFDTLLKQAQRGRKMRSS
ncbi:uncharacterized protein si:dkey-93h22.8 [Carassius gibelio]|uniref:uncharacterized protein si:dkey-93h22.8 n=1 Tax=Carassius gibelio TaxID=101364 RepID=UPI0022797EFE|nr:uncharacterized protein si:dkey-93h22.8 [Carassius gibelio]